MPRNWLPFVRRRTPVVGISIGPRRYYALIDTGAQISMIAPDIAIRLGLATVGLQRMIGITGEIDSVSVVQLPSFHFGKIELPYCRAALINVKRLNLGIQLILGGNAFANRRLQFDFKDERVYIVE
jgi:predicted aspartyl protease